MTLNYALRHVISIKKYRNVRMSLDLNILKRYRKILADPEAFSSINTREVPKDDGYLRVFMSAVIGKEDGGSKRYMNNVTDLLRR